MARATTKKSAMAGFTLSQQMMIADGLPPALLLSAVERAQVWADQPPRSLPRFVDDKPKVSQQVLAQLEAEINRPQKKVRTPIDTRGMRWDPRKSKWVPDPFITATTQDATMKWKITSFDAEGNVIPRASSTIDEGLPMIEVYAKMGAIYHRHPTPEIIAKMVVNDQADGLIREWEVGGAVLPKPEEATPAKGKGKSNGKKTNGKPAKGDKAQAAKKGQAGAKAKSDKPKGPGVIATVIEIINRDKGASVEEMVEILSKKFPEREVKGMTSTIRIQANKNNKRKEKDEKRGLVYYGKK